MAHAHQHHGAEKVFKGKKLEANADMNITPMIDVLLVLLVIGAAVQFWVGRSVSRQDAQQQYLLHQAVIAQSLATHAPAAARGDAAAFAALGQVKSGLAGVAAEAPPGLTGDAVEALVRARAQAQASLDQLLAAQPALQTAAEADARVRGPCSSRGARCARRSRATTAGSSNWSTSSS